MNRNSQYFSESISKLTPIMKTSLITITLGVVFVSAIIGMSPVSQAHAMPKATITSAYLSTNKELLIQVAEINEKNFQLVRQNIEASGGMTYKGFCKELKVLMYVMDSNVHSNYNFLNVAFMNVSLGYMIKEGTISQVLTTCEMPIPVDQQQSQN
jgi:hypothetical protein